MYDIVFRTKGIKFKPRIMLNCKLLPVVGRLFVCLANH